jgi:inositol-1,3,4-trisphosphate 5/6-kinase/inositol-tetrakisphosphate 1-kinase
MLPFADQTFMLAGYGKMPGYEHVFTDFLLSLAQKEYKRRPSYGSLSSGEG